MSSVVVHGSCSRSDCQKKVSVLLDGNIVYLEEIAVLLEVVAACCLRRAVDV